MLHKCEGFRGSACYEEVYEGRLCINNAMLLIGEIRESLECEM